MQAINIHKIYKSGNKDLHVLKGIDLKIEKGEFVSILGPSGAGKSTLLHILGGLDEPTEGSVVLDNEDIYRLSDSKRAALRNRRAGFVFQSYHLLSEFSALENVALPAMIQGAVPAKAGTAKAGTAKAAELLELVGLKARAHHRPPELSGGEQQRTAIARALVNSPELLLCDEPTGNLDSETGKDIIELLYRLNREKKTTVVVVTHEEVIAKKADRVIHIKDGSLVT